MFPCFQVCVEKVHKQAEKKGGDSWNVRGKWCSVCTARSSTTVKRSCARKSWKWKTVKFLFAWWMFLRGGVFFVFIFIKYMEKANRVLVVYLLHNKLIPDTVKRPLADLFSCSFSRDLLSYHLFGRTLKILSTQKWQWLASPIRGFHIQRYFHSWILHSPQLVIKKSKKKKKEHPPGIIAIKLKRQSNYIMWHQANPNPNTNPNPNPCINPNLAH